MLNLLRRLTFKVMLSHVDHLVQNIPQTLSFAITLLKSEIAKVDIPHRNIFVSQIESQLQTFIQQLVHSPKLWLQMLEQNLIQLQGNRITINSPFVITIIYQQIIANVNRRIAQKVSNGLKQESQETPTFCFQTLYCDQTALNIIATILNNYAKQIVLNFEQGKAYIIEQIQDIQELLKKSQIMNSYTLFSLLKQMSRWSHNYIIQNLRKSFLNIDQKAGNMFCSYIQKNYAILHLHYRTYDTNIILTEDEINKKIRQSLIKTVFMVSLQQTSTKPQINEQTSKLVDQMIIQSMGKEKKKKKYRKAVSIKDRMNSLCNFFKKNLKSQIVNANQQSLSEQLMSTSAGVPQSASFGSSLGKCLVDIDQYETANDFFADLSRTAMVGGSITILLQEIPILHYFIIAGGLSYTVYKTYQDQITSSLRKMKQIGKASFLAAGSVTAIIAGMMIGEIIIPIPIVGAFIGGIFGGFIAEKGSRQINAILNNKGFMGIIKVLQETIINQSHWDYSPDLLQKLGIDRKYFQLTFCKIEQERNSFMTGLCFCIVTYYESRKQIEYTAKKLKQEEKKEKEGNNKKEQMKELRQGIENAFNIVAITEYLTQNKIYLVSYLSSFENTIKHLIN